MISEQEVHAIGKAIAEAVRAKHAREEWYVRAFAAFTALDRWLAEHPRGHAEILGDENGRIFHLIHFDEGQADESASCTGFGEDTLTAMVAALAESKTTNKSQPPSATD
jgi:hypothetical protein